MKLIKIKVTYKNKQGSLVSAYNFYLQLDNGNRIAVQPLRYEVNGNKYSNYNELSVLAEEVENLK